VGAGSGLRAEDRGAPWITVFVCANSARAGLPPACGACERPAPLPVAWPFQAHEVVVPCTGKLQPEHLLKAFEAGTDLVCILACEADNCHYLEGSRRAQRRVEYVRGLLDELGLGGERLLLFHLPGSAKEDMALGCGGASGGARQEGTAGRLAAVCEELAGKLKALGRSPLHQDGLPAS
jgi:coenzyme F420-reducing hydrogenase delta subunit